MKLSAEDLEIFGRYLELLHELEEDNKDDI